MRRSHADIDRSLSPEQATPSAKRRRLDNSNNDSANKTTTIKLGTKTPRLHIITSTNSSTRNDAGVNPRSSDATPTRSATSGTIPRIVLKLPTLKTPVKSSQSILPLFAAIESNDFKTFQSLAKHYSDHSAQSPLIALHETTLFGSTFTWSLLHCASYYGITKAVKLLMKIHGADVEVRDTWYRGTPLAWAAFGGHEPVCRLLVETYNASPNTPNSKGQIPFDLLSDPSDLKWSGLLYDIPKKNPHVPSAEKGPVLPKSQQPVAEFKQQKHTDQNTPRKHQSKNWAKEVWQKLVHYKDATGRQVSELFLELPLKSEYPEYYQVIENPLALNTIERRIRKGYKSEKDFEVDCQLVFDNALTFNQPESQVYKDAKLLRKLFHSYRKEVQDATEAATIPIRPVIQVKTPAHKEKVEKKVETVKVTPKQNTNESNRKTLEELVNDKGLEVMVGDFVYCDVEGYAKQSVALIKELWTDNKKEKWFKGNLFLRPEQTQHRPARRFLEQEILKTERVVDSMLSNVTGLCYVMHVKEYINGKPESFQPKDVYVCDMRYSEETTTFSMVKDWARALGLEPVRPSPFLIPYPAPLKLARTIAIRKDNKSGLENGSKEGEESTHVRVTKTKTPRKAGDNDPAKNRVGDSGIKKDGGGKTEIDNTKKQGESTVGKKKQAQTTDRNGNKTVVNATPKGQSSQTPKPKVALRMQSAPNTGTDTKSMEATGKKKKSVKPTKVAPETPIQQYMSNNFVAPSSLPAFRNQRASSNTFASVSSKQAKSSTYPVEVEGEDFEDINIIDDEEEVLASGRVFIPPKAVATVPPNQRVPWTDMRSEQHRTRFASHSHLPASMPVPAPSGSGDIRAGNGAEELDDLDTEIDAMGRMFWLPSKRKLKEGAVPKTGVRFLRSIGLTASHKAYQFDTTPPTAPSYAVYLPPSTTTINLSPQIGSMLKTAENRVRLAVLQEGQLVTTVDRSNDVENGLQPNHNYTINLKPGLNVLEIWVSIVGVDKEVLAKFMGESGQRPEETTPAATGSESEEVVKPQFQQYMVFVSTFR